MPSITLESSDGKSFVVDQAVARRSGTIRNLLEVCEGADAAEAVPIPNVSGVILQFVIQWATHHKDDPLPAETDEMDHNTDNIPEWDVKFFKDLATGKTIFNGT